MLPKLLYNLLGHVQQEEALKLKELLFNEKIIIKTKRSTGDNFICDYRLIIKFKSHNVEYWMQLPWMCPLYFIFKFLLLCKIWELLSNVIYVFCVLTFLIVWTVWFLPLKDQGSLTLYYITTIYLTHGHQLCTKRRSG